MRTATVSLILAAGIASAGATVAWAQAPAVTAPPSTPTPAAAPPSGPAPTTSSAPLSQTSPVPPASPATPAGAAPQGVAPTGAPAAAAPEATPNPAEAPPTIPTTGDGAVIINVLEKVCVPLVRGGNLDQLAPQLPGMRKNRRDGTWSMPLGGSRDYQLTVLAQGVNKDVCQAEVHFAVGQDAPIVKAINIWSFLHKPELISTANYVAVEADGVKRVRKSWEHLESNSSTAVNFTTWRKPDDSPLNRGYDTGILYYQERKF
jgi:hypothetical protein